MYSDNPEKIIALAEEVFFLDSDIDFKKLQKKRKFFVMSRNFDGQRQVTIDLSGLDGGAPQPPVQEKCENSQPANNGKGGQDCSDFIAVYQNKRGFDYRQVGSGGDGGNGQRGGDGKSTDKTKPPVLEHKDGWIANHECGAWSGGDVRVKK